MTNNSQPLVDPARILLPLGLGTALSLMGDATLYTVLPTHTAEAGIALASVGLMLGVNRAVRLVFNGLAGTANDRWSRRWLFVCALFVGAISTAIYAVGRGFWPLLIGRALWGLAWSGIWVGGTTMLLDVTTWRDRGRWIGLYQTWFFLGSAGGSFVGGLLTDQVGYTATMWIGAALTALGGCAALIWLPETHSARPRQSGRTTRASSLSMLNNRGVWLAAALYGVNRFAIAGVLSATLGLLVQERLSWAQQVIGIATLTGLLSAGRTVLSMGAAPLAGTLSDRLRSRWKVLAWGLAIAALGMFLMSQDGLLTLLPGIVFGAIASGGIQSLAAVLVGDWVQGHYQGRAIGLVHTVGDLGSAVGPPLAYMLLPWIGLSWLYLLCAGGFGAVLALVFWTRPHPANRPNE